ncbi:glycosyltransferase family 2 protein [Ruania zhangjianzhongii]|uniref:glycosyltransferase family 2 protein n=1 Tax=Ruania zhangjianzhongii TaxID=2603206 RepID=UPI0011CC317A|nr:glycosyltransferase family 2 protein [Ruania zhangjianzhongii]
MTIARSPEADVLSNPVGYTRAALRTRSGAVLDLLARATTRGEHDHTGFAARLRDPAVPSAWFDSRRRATFASLLTALSTDGAHADAALAGWLVLQRARGAAGMGETAQLLLAQLALQAGRRDVVRTVLATGQRLHPTIRHYLEVDLANPYSQAGRPIGNAAGPAAHRVWERLLGEPFAQAGLTPPTVSTTEATFFDGLAAPSSPSTGGPLVSVIMPSYRPDAGLLTSVTSILAQTHAHLELIIVDDASGPSYWPWYERAQALDSRVRVLTLEANGGTYPARNAGLREATGEYIAFQDSDDWSHPERLRRQLDVLQKNPEASGSLSEAIRAMDDLTHQWLGYSPRRRNASSLMIRHEVLAAVGPFDPVRKSADSEFYERIQHAVGPVLDVSQPLAITRLRAGTLSRSDFRYGWMHPERLLYRESYRHWHRTAAELRMPADGTRPFAAPPSFTTARGELDPTEVDVLVVADLSVGAVDLARFDELLQQVASSGLTLGVLHQEDAFQARAQRPDLDPEVLERAARSQCHLLASTTPVDARVVLVPDPHLLLTRREPPPRVHTTAVLTVVRVPTRAEEVLDHLAVSDGCRHAFGRRPRWVTRSERDLTTLTEDGFSGLGLLAEEIELLADEVGMIGEGGGPH